MEKESFPILNKRLQFETVFRSELMLLFSNEPITMLLVHRCTVKPKNARPLSY